MMKDDGLKVRLFHSKNLLFLPPPSPSNAHSFRRFLPQVSNRDAYTTKIHQHYRSDANLFILTQNTPPGFSSAAEAFAVAAYLIVNDPRARQAVFDEENEVTIISKPQAHQQDDFPRVQEEETEEKLVSFCWLWAEELVGMLSRMERLDLGPGRGRVKRDRGNDEVGEERGERGRGRVG